MSAGDALLLINPGLCKPEQPKTCLHDAALQPNAQGSILASTCQNSADNHVSYMQAGMNFPPGVDRPQLAEKALDVIFVKRLPSHQVVLANASQMPQTYTCYRFWPAEVSQPSAISAFTAIFISQHLSGLSAVISLDLDIAPEMYHLYYRL